MSKEERGHNKPVRVRSHRTTGTAGRAPKRTKRSTKKEDAELAISTSPSLTYLSKADIRRHVHEGLKPYQRLADQAGMHFLSYLIAMAVMESSGEQEKVEPEASLGLNEPNDK